MALRFADHLTDVADILGSAVTSAGQVLAQIGDSTDGVGYGQNLETWGPDGWAARPNTGTKGNCARSIFLYDGAKKRVIGSVDVRHLSRAGTMNVGDRCIYTNGPARVKVYQATDIVELYSESGGNPVKVTVDGANNKVMIETASGAKLEVVGNTATMQTSSASVSINAGGDVTVLPTPGTGKIYLGHGASTATPVAIMVGIPPGTPTPSTYIFGVV
jgi:hypothetical protein